MKRLVLRMVKDFVGKKKNGNLTFFMFQFPLLVLETLKKSLHLEKFVQYNKHQDQPDCLLTFVLSTSYV